MRNPQKSKVGAVFGRVNCVLRDSIPSARGRGPRLKRRSPDLRWDWSGSSESLPCAALGGAYFVAGVFADVGDIPINPHRHLLANQIRLYGMTNHPPTGYPSSLRLLNKFKKTYPLEKFVTHEFPVDQVDRAMAQAFDIDACMKVVLTPSGG